MTTTLRYSTFRILLFVVSLALLWLVGLRDPILLLLAAATVSMLLSLFLLSGMREKMSIEVAERIERGQERKARKRNAGVVTDEDVEDGIVAGRPTAGAAGSHSATTAAEDPDGFR